jgi:hypothetical protein
MGVLRQATGDYASGIMVLAGALAMSATIVLARGRVMALAASVPRETRAAE